MTAIENKGGKEIEDIKEKKGVLQVTTFIFTFPLFLLI
jgi:hypothetical protein